MHKSATKCNETIDKWCKNKHGASKIIDTLETYQPPPYSLTVLAGAFPDSNETAAAALKEYRAEQEIVPNSDPKAEISSGELVALAKGRLHSVAKLGRDLHEAIVSVFETLWPGRAVPSKIQALLQWIPLAPNRLDIWKESAARAGAE
jgi:hypothetical protein